MIPGPIGGEQGRRRASRATQGRRGFCRCRLRHARKLVELRRRPLRARRWNRGRLERLSHAGGIHGSHRKNIPALNINESIQEIWNKESEMDLLSQAADCQRQQWCDLSKTTMMWPQRLFVRLETSENIHEDEEKFEKFFSRTQKYFTCPASCEGEWEYGLLGKHTMASTRWLVVSKWLESIEKVFVFFGGKFKCFFGTASYDWRGTAPRATSARANGLVDSSTSTWRVQTVV